ASIRRGDLGFALGLVLIMVVLIMPLPAWLLDIALAMSITLAVLILMAVEFNSFPVVLLIATLLRLALNLASTRLILAHGHEGTAAAGHVIQAFGGFIMGDSFVIGVIDEQEAKSRREELQKESDFFGAMDGASKFVRGDAVAGLIITAINVIGGMIIGMAQRDLPFSVAADTYTRLTVGDGLVTQIPALVVSTAAGIMVS